jgi:hypothetical protein
MSQDHSFCEYSNFIFNASHSCESSEFNHCLACFENVNKKIKRNNTMDNRRQTLNVLQTVLLGASVILINCIVINWKTIHLLLWLVELLQLDSSNANF